ncbi:MAG: DMT family transporter [Acidovorax sp.]|jgi:drug/metabolite transporter (DMT)-like permease|nr:DMT family transporter [Acidovorax sp.]
MKTLHSHDAANPGANHSPSSLPIAAAASVPQGGTWRMVLAMALSGTIGLLVVESGLPVLLVVWLRCLLGGLGLAAWLLCSRQWVAPTRREWGWIVLGGAALVGNWLALFSAYHYSSIAVATVVYHVQPFLLLVLVALFQGQALPLRRLPWLVLALVGVALSSGFDGGLAATTSWPGVVLALLAASLYAVATLLTQRLQRIPAAQIAMLQMAVGGLLLAGPAWLEGGTADFTARAWTAVLVLGLVHTACMYTLMYAAFQRLPAQAIAGLSFIYPAMALLVDLLWFGVRPAPAQWLGMAVILGAVWGWRRGAKSNQPK